jgi:transposase
VQQSLADLPEAKAARATLKRSFDKAILALEKRMAAIALQAGRQADVQRCQAIEGIGPITATALANTFTSGRFTCADAFIAFLGLDVRVRDSGKKTGKRCLTKQGDPELRRLLYNAAMSAKRHPRWASTYQRYLDRGMATTQAFVAIARKLARVAFALMKNQSTYRSASGDLATQT